MLLAGNAGAACHLQGLPVGPAVMAGMMKSPQILLTTYPQGGFGLQGAVAELATHGSEAIAAVRSVFPRATKDQAHFIGLGMADALKVCSIQDPAIAQDIRDAVKASGSSTIRQSFLLATEDLDSDPVASTPETPVGSTVHAAAPAVDMELGTPPGHAAVGLADPFGPIDGWH